MREIKFRAWDKRRKQMYRVNSVHFDDPLYGVWCWVDYYDVINQGLYPRQIKAKALDLMQYTGLNDIAMKEVYEDDIIDFADEGFRTLLVVKWYATKAGFALERTDGGVTLFSMGEAMNCGRVIGNIYENPELLERKDHA